MARIIEECISVTLTDKRITSFTWRRRQHQVIEILDAWRERGEWWAGEHARQCYRVRTAGNGVIDLYSKAGTDTWTLCGAID